MRSNWALGALPSLDSIGLSLTLCEPRSPTVQLHPVTLPEQVIITITAWEDCIRCATTARRRPFFRFPNLPGEPLSSSSPALRDSVNDVRTEIPTLGYMPAGLVLCIAAIANLSVDMDALPDAVVKAKATAIEQAVRSWRPLPPLNGIESAAFVEQTSTCEMWRHVCSCSSRSSLSLIHI